MEKLPKKNTKEALLDLLVRESRRSYDDGAADEGLGLAVARLAGQMAGAGWKRLSQAFDGYTGLDRAGRQSLVTRALAALGETGAPLPKGAGPSDAVTTLSGVGPRRASGFRKLGIETILDLLHYFPRDWQDRSKLQTISTLRPGQLATVRGQIQGASQFRTRQRMTITEVAFKDGTGMMTAVYFNQPYQGKRFQPGLQAIFTGKTQMKRNQLQLMNPEVEFLPEDGGLTVHTGRIVPLYPLIKEVGQKALREAAWAAQGFAKAVGEVLPETLRAGLDLAELGEALSQIHFPSSQAALEKARRRLVFDEFFQITLAMALRRAQLKKLEAPRLEKGSLASSMLQSLPFEMTGAQKRVWKQIQADLAKGEPMNRLVQGDVGSGKTLVAALALLRAVESGYQAALMAPTEILADQHVINLRKWMEPLGVEVLRLVQAQKGAGRREVLRHLESGQPLVAVGTQALIQKSVDFGRLGLVVIDEQHRFGVQQRLTLSKKAKSRPHVLVMTATPIPRTLSMTLYGDLDVSIVDEMPPGRTPIETEWIKPRQRPKAYKHIENQIRSGRQAYLVYALVDESDKTQWKAATQMVEHLDRDVFPDYEVALLHGRMKPEEKEGVMARFKAGEVQVLCSTTVVEVGVDVPNATVMMIEDADRFGLAQLHQLRGRVGRGEHASTCFLVGDPKTDEGKARLKAMAATSDGFKIAEEDFRLRGGGEILGLRQSGLPDLKLGDLFEDQELLLEAKKKAEELVRIDPGLNKGENRPLREFIKSRLDRKLEWGDVG